MKELSLTPVAPVPFPERPAPLEALDVAYNVARGFFIPGADPDDVLQEAAVALLEAARCFDPAAGASFRTFASGVVRRRLIDAVKFEQRERRVGFHDAVRLDEPYDLDGEAGSRHDVTPSPVDVEEQIEHRERLGRIAAAMRTLTPLERRWLVHAVTTGAYSVDVDGGRNKTADNAVTRARRKLREAA